MSDEKTSDEESAGVEKGKDQLFPTGISHAIKVAGISQPLRAPTVR